MLRSSPSAWATRARGEITRKSAQRDSRAAEAEPGSATSTTPPRQTANRMWRGSILGSSGIHDVLVSYAVYIVA